MPSQKEAEGKGYEDLALTFRNAENALPLKWSKKQAMQGAEVELLFKDSWGMSFSEVPGCGSV